MSRPQAQTSALQIASPHIHPHATRFDRARLALLLPEMAQAASHDQLSYALAFVAHYPRDVALLELEWDWLVAALRVAWQQDDLTSVARLAAALAHACGRVSGKDAMEVLRRGIVATLCLGDIPTQARLMNCLGCLLNARGDYEEGWRIWHRSLALMPDAMLSAIWEPFLSFAYVVDIITEFSLPHQFTLPMTDDATEGAIVVRFVRGYLARVHDDLATARAEMSMALRLLSQHEGGAGSSPPQHLMRAAILAELARVQKDYPQARAHAQTAITLAHLYADTYTYATLLIDHIFFSYWMGHYADTQATFLRLREVAGQIATPHVQHVCSQWEAVLSGAVTPAPSPPALPPASPIHGLTTREREVLHLVATGCSNQEIAHQLVVTPATVKKHLEHIYAKLAVHSRTAAVALLHVDD